MTTRADSALRRAPAPQPEPQADAEATAWPEAGGARIVFLLDAASGLEESLLREWIEQRKPSDAPPHDVVTVPASRRPRRGRTALSSLEAALAAGDDPLLAPMRVIWLPPRRRGGSGDGGLVRLLLFGDPYDPGPLRQRWIRRREPARCRIISGEPARLSELRRRWRELGGADTGETGGLVDFVTRQAGLALERSERRIRGLRYKVPRFVHESILGRPAFQGGLARLAWESGRDVAGVRHEAEQILREIAATHSPYMIDLTAQICRLLYTRAYDEQLDYDRAELERLYSLAQRYPVCFLPSHRSNLDHLVLQYALYENGHPPNHTAGGINMNFFPFGPLFRRSGVFFIRRTFKDDAVYKFVLRHYIDYLIEKRFPLEWYIEGGRSRSGKLLPPRFGLLAYVVDSYRRAKSEDVVLVPVSISYDQIQDVSAYVAEQRGAKKEREGFRWFLRVFRALGRRYGRIHIRFGEALSLRETLGPPHTDAETEIDEQNLEIQKLAFETAVRINRATPFTATSLVALAMLAAGDRALTLAELDETLAEILDYVRARNLPVTGDVRFDEFAWVETTLSALESNGVVTCYRGGPEAVYAIEAEQHLAAAYYRNTVAHFFVPGAIAELALVRAADENLEDRERLFWHEVVRLRDLLKFEFFFSDKETFRREIDAEAELHDPNWKQALADGPAPVLELLRRFKPFSAHLVLRPFVEAYRVVADALARDDPAAPVIPEKLTKHCLGLGQQYLLQHRLRSGESVSQVLFQTALRLAANRRLLEGSGGEVAERRLAFAREIHDVIRRIDAIDSLAASRRAGLID